jgi:hypothetical protein
MKNKILILFAALTFSAQLFANGGSVYSRFGIGDLYHSNNAMQISLGGLGTSIINKLYVNTNNPASIYQINNTKFGVSLNSNISYLNDGISNATYSNVKFSGFHIAFPIKESLGIGFIVGMKPYSSVDYEIVQSGNLPNVNSSNEDYKGSGGISKVFLGVSTLLPFDLALGLTFDYYTGNIQYSSTTFYADSSGFYDSYFINEFKYKGLGATIGLESPDLAKVFKMDGISNFRLGLTYEMSGSISTDSAIVVRTTIGESTFNSSKFDTKIPFKFGAGLNFTINNKYLLVLDYLYQPWSKFEQNQLNSSYLRDLTRYSFGVEYGDQLKRFASFWELIKYRCGLSYEQTQYQINGEGINQLGIHAGIAFPLGLENSIDIGLMYGVRGTNDFNLLKENIIQASFSINLGEFWFIRRER